MLSSPQEDHNGMVNDSPYINVFLDINNVQALNTAVMSFLVPAVENFNCDSPIFVN